MVMISNVGALNKSRYCFEIMSYLKANAENITDFLTIRFIFEQHILDKI